MRSVSSCSAFLLALAVITNAAVGFDDPPKKLTDAEISKLLVGKWTVEDSNDKGLKIKLTVKYAKDGTFETEATLTAGEKSLNLMLSGTWKVTDGMIIATVTKTGAPDLFKEGHVSKDQVLAIDEKTIKYKTEKGKEVVYKRAKE